MVKFCCFFFYSVLSRNFKIVTFCSKFKHLFKNGVKRYQSFKYRYSKTQQRALLIQPNLQRLNEKVLLVLLFCCWQAT